MALTPAQKATLKAAIEADATLNAFPNNSDGNDAIAKALNLEASPVFWVWRSNVARAEVYGTQNDLAVSGAQTGFWNWTTYKNQGATEQNAWTQMFMGDEADFSKPNLRAGVSAIFTGSAAATAQANHVLAIAREHASRGEKILATGAGTTADPATRTFEGDMDYHDVEQARNS